MPNSTIFLFQAKVHENTRSFDYNLYLFKDFSGQDHDVQEEIFDILDEIRQRVHSPEKIYIICKDHELLDKRKIESRFLSEQAISYIDYKDVPSNIFRHGLAEIVTKNKVVQYAPHGTRFKKTSGAESDYFIKASLSLLEYPEICFIALATYHKITAPKLVSLKKIYVDTSSIISLVQAVIFCSNLLEGSELNPQIINFKSYKQNNIDFNLDGSFTIISASSSGNLRKDNHINNGKYLTLFYPKTTDQKEECLFELDNIPNESTCISPRLIPLTTEDFSLEYAKSKEIVIKQQEIRDLDSKKLIQKLLDDEFKNISFHFSFNEIKNRDCIEFDQQYLYSLLEKNNFIDDTLSRALSLEKDNCLIYDFKNPRESSPNIHGITKNDFMTGEYEGNIDKKNIIIFFIQAANSELIQISQKLRNHSVNNITYIIGVLITDDCQQSKNLESNLCFNDTSYKYGFYCYLNLPLSTVIEADIDSYKLSNGFVFYDDNPGRSAELHPKQVYLVVCLILELLRSNGKLLDNISHHDVISPKNFSRFNDSLLQLSLLKAARGRELNFHSNLELSREMKDIIIDLIREKEGIGKVFVEALKDQKIKLTEEDFLEIKQQYPLLFITEEEI